jgi:hypothetical protein
MGQKTTLHERLPCNKRENRCYPYLPSNCRLCTEVTETQDHIFKCNQCEERKRIRKNFALKLQNYLDDTQTCKNTTRVIIYYINCWIHDEAPEPLSILIPDASYDLKLAVTAQETIGWKNFLKGRISKKMGDTVQSRQTKLFEKSWKTTHI